MRLRRLVVLIFRHRFAVVIRIFSTCSAEVLTFLAELMSLTFRELSFANLEFEELL